MKSNFQVIQQLIICVGIITICMLATYYGVEFFILNVFFVIILSSKFQTKLKSKRVLLI